MYSRRQNSGTPSTRRCGFVRPCRPCGTFLSTNPPALHLSPHSFLTLPQPKTRPCSHAVYIKREIHELARHQTHHINMSTLSFRSTMLLFRSRLLVFGVCKTRSAHSYASTPGCGLTNTVTMPVTIFQCSNFTPKRRLTGRHTQGLRNVRGDVPVGQRCRWASRAAVHPAQNEQIQIMTPSRRPCTVGTANHTNLAESSAA